ncbi:FERM and PDZ domain-containing protein 1 [Varanus komodoensis]|nr:FERM and PDZ domain-containing protein 1 [Varanus komodoensis]
MEIAHGISDLLFTLCTLQLWLYVSATQRKTCLWKQSCFCICMYPLDFPCYLMWLNTTPLESIFYSCSDVLQERFAVEMKCSVALRLAALHIQERIITCAQPQKVSLKYIEKDWGIENFISPTLLRNMRGKDIKKAISFHMKRNQLLLDPRQKHLLSAAQVRLCYLQILGDLKLYGGKIFNATLMLQDRESCVALLVGAKYGISQVVNNKLNIITILAEFANISRLELTEESDKVSMVKIYLQDIKVLTLLLESNSAKDMACLISGYYRMFVDSSSSIYFWGEREPQMHRFSAEEGYESRTGSDSEESSEWDSSLDRFSAAHSPQHSCLCPPLEGQREQEEPGQERKDPEVKEKSFCNGYSTNDSWSEASDSANLGSRELKTSASSDSMDALEEDDLEACSSSQPEFFHFYTPTVQELTGNDKALSGTECEEGSQAAEESVFSFLLPTSLPLSTLAQPETQFRKESESCASAVASRLAENDAMEYYSLCANISPASSGERNTQSNSPECGSWNGLDGDEGICVGKGGAPGLILAPPPGFGDTSSDDEFYDTAEAVTPTEMQAVLVAHLHNVSGWQHSEINKYKYGTALLTNKIQSKMQIKIMGKLKGFFFYNKKKKVSAPGYPARAEIPVGGFQVIGLTLDPKLSPPVSSFLLTASLDEGRTDLQRSTRQRTGEGNAAAMKEEAPFLQHTDILQPVAPLPPQSSHACGKQEAGIPLRSFIQSVENIKANSSH